MEPINDLEELLKHELKDLYSAETQLIEALPDMASKATNPKLKKAFQDHLAVTREHKKRLTQIQKLLSMETATPNPGFFARLFSSDEGEEHCKAMEGLIEEAQSLMDEDMAPVVMDAALIAAAQKVEHYEIASYGTAKAYSMLMGLEEVTRLLSATLTEEYFADDSLSELAMTNINRQADDAGKLPVSGESDNVPVKEPAKKATAQKAAPRKAAKKAAPKKAVKKAAKKK